MCNGQSSLNRHLSEEDCTIRSICNNFYNVTFLHVVRTSNLVLRDRNLLESLLIHEDVTSWILIKVLIRTTLNTNILKLETNLEGTLKHTAVSNILQLCDHNGVTLAWLTVLEVDASPNFTIKTNTCSNLDFLWINHNLLISNLLFLYVDISLMRCKVTENMEKNINKGRKNHCFLG